ncbi:hypothetical protein Tco_0066929 [Tanacetum coccineum]
MRPIIIPDENEEGKEAENYDDTYATSHEETEDSSVPHPPSPKTVQLKELTNQVLLLQSQNQELEQQKTKAEAEVAFFIAKPSYLNVDQLSQLLVSSIKPELSKLLSFYDFSSFIPFELKEHSSKITVLSGEVNDLKKHVQGMKTEQPKDLKEILNKLDTFTTIISSLTSQVAELKTLQWKLPAEFLALPNQVSLVQEKLKTLDALPSLLNKVTDTLNKFSHIMENASHKSGDKGVPSAGQCVPSPAEGEKNTNQATISQLNNNNHSTNHHFHNNTISITFPLQSPQRALLNLKGS